MRSFRRIPQPPGGRVGRLFVVSSLLASVGFGLYGAGSLVYFNQVVGLSVAQVGLGLSIAALVWLPLAIPLGLLADRVGPREACIAATAAQVVLLLITLMVRSFAVFLIVIVLLGVAEQSANLSRNAMVVGMVQQTDRVRLMAITRSSFNLGLTLGLLLAGVAIGINTVTSYSMIMIGNALISLAVAALMFALPRIPGVRGTASAGRGNGAWKVLRDRPYAALAVMAGLITLSETMLSVALPLWIVNETQAPRSLAAWIVAINTILVVVLQVRISRGAETVDGARRFQRLACSATAVSCVLFSVTHGLSAVTAAIVLAAGVVVLTIGELWSSAAIWKFKFDMAPPDAQGQYSGLFSLSNSLRGILGPAALTALTGTFGMLGWLGIGAFFLVLLLAVNPVVAWLVRTRPAVVGAVS